MLRVTYHTPLKQAVSALEAPDGLLDELYEALAKRYLVSLGAGLYRVKGFRVGPATERPRQVAVTVELVQWNCECE